jgi:DNA polymerase-3 subunit chi
VRVDFYLLGTARIDIVVAALAARALGNGQRLLVVDADGSRREALGKALWDARPEQFLANGLATQPHAERQPILLSGSVDPVNGARLLCLADGEWREAQGFERVFYLVDEAGLAEARRQWRRLGEEPQVERRFWKQDEAARWVEGP